jgi:hypothetical protein
LDAGDNCAGRYIAGDIETDEGPAARSLSILSNEHASASAIAVTGSFLEQRGIPAGKERDGIGAGCRWQQENNKSKTDNS